MTTRLQDFDVQVAVGRAAFDLGPTSANWMASILLKPSFDPQLCLTVSARGDALPPASVLELANHFWSLELPQGQDTSWIVSGVAVGTSTTVVLDGMGFEIAARSPEGVRRREGHVLRDADVRVLLQHILPSLHRSIADPDARRALATAGLYVDVHLDTSQVPPSRPAARVAVLGSPDDRAQVIAALSKKS